jgi:hypothetical protein
MKESESVLLCTDSTALVLTRWLIKQDADIYQQGIEKIVQTYDKCFSLGVGFCGRSLDTPTVHWRCDI